MKELIAPWTVSRSGSRARLKGQAGSAMLVVDDDSTVTDLLSLYFEDKGFRVYAAADGVEGMSLALCHRPDVVICDIVMPQMHGFEMLKALRAHRELAGAVIVVVSAKAYKPDIDRAREMGADAYFVKPFDVGELHSAIERECARRRT